MKLYENVFIARPELSPAQVETLVAKFSEIIKKIKGSVEKTEYCGLRNLAYPIKKSTKGHYIVMNIKAPTSVVSELERNMRINEDTIRYLTVRVEAHETGPSALMQQGRQGSEKFDKKKRFDKEHKPYDKDFKSRARADDENVDAQ
jgi:small subunit ribosomal protein S6